MVRIPEKSIFASAAADGCVRVSNQIKYFHIFKYTFKDMYFFLLQLWDCSKFEGSNLANKAHRLFNHHNGSALNSLAVSADGHLLISGAENGSICVYK